MNILQGMGNIFQHVLQWQSNAKWCEGDCEWVNEACVSKNGFKRLFFDKSDPTFPRIRDLFNLIWNMKMIIVVFSILLVAMQLAINKFIW